VIETYFLTTCHQILTDDYQQTHQTEQQTEHSEGEEDAEIGVCHLEEMLQTLHGRNKGEAIVGERGGEIGD